MRLTFLAILLLASCNKPSSTIEYAGLNFSGEHPRTWKVISYADSPNDARVEFDFPGSGFATVIVFHPENRSAFEQYTQVAATNFPKIHEQGNPAQKVTTLGVGEKTSLGSFDAVTNRFSVLVAPRQVECSFTYVDLTTSGSVMLIDVYNEGTSLGSSIIPELEKFIASIQPKKQSGEQGGGGQPATHPEPE